MKIQNKIFGIILAALGFACSLYLTINTSRSVRFEKEDPPDDWFIRQRAFPFEDVPYDAKSKAFEKFKTLLAGTPLTRSGKSLGSWKLVGPSNIGGRITSLALHPRSDSIIIAGTADGGVWRSTDR